MVLEHNEDEWRGLEDDEHFIWGDTTQDNGFLLSYIGDHTVDEYRELVYNPSTKLWKLHRMLRYHGFHNEREVNQAPKPCIMWKEV